MPQAWQVRQHCKDASQHSAEALANLELHDVPKPVPGPKAALIRIHAVALNARDLLVLVSSPLYPVPTSAGLVPCSDAAGIVEEVGTGSVWKVGDRVILHPNTWLTGRDERNFDITNVFGAGTVAGTLTEYMVVGDERLIKVPGHLSLEEASVLPTAGSTACHSLFFAPEQPVGEGTWVLVQGTGGVSTIAIQVLSGQLAAAAGATVIATSSSDQKLALSKQLGAHYTINYRHTPDWDEEVMKITDGKGVDFVLDVGGAGTIEHSLSSLRQGGHASVVGILTPAKEVDIVPAILYGAKTVRGQLGSSKAMGEDLVRRVNADNIHPIIARIFEWSEAKEAFEFSMSQSGVGKIVVKGVPAGSA